MVDRPRSYLGYGMLMAMRWLGLLLLVSCTLITDPDSFEGEGTDSGEVDGGLDAPETDSSLDAPTPDVPGVDTRVEPTCCGVSCEEPLPGVFTTEVVERWMRTPSPLDSPPAALRQIQLVPGPDEVFIVRRNASGYEVYTLGEGDPTGPDTLRDWLTVRGVALSCMDPAPIQDADVQVTSMGVQAALVQEGLLPVEDSTTVYRVGSACTANSLAEAIPAGWASVTRNSAASAVRIGGETSLLVGGTRESYEAVFGVAGRDQLLAVLNLNSELNVEYWTGGTRQAGIATPNDFTSRGVSIAQVGTDDWVVAFGSLNRLVLDRVHLPFEVGRTTFPSTSIGERIAIAPADPMRNLAIVISTTGAGEDRIAVLLVNYESGEVGTLFETGLANDAVGVDVLVQPPVMAGPPIVTFVAETSRSTRAWQTTLCGPTT